MSLLLCNCYRPSNSARDFWESLQNQLDCAKQGKITNIIMIGDFNAHLATPTGKNFCYFLEQNHLKYHIEESTRITMNTSSCLDQIISNIPLYVRQPTVLPPVGSSDHCSVTADLHIEKDTCYQRKVWNYDKANYNVFRTELANHNWESCFTINCPDTACSILTNDFLAIADRCIPNKIVTIRPRDVPCYNSNLRRLKRIRDRSHSYAKRKISDQAWATYRLNRNKYTNELHSAEENYYHDLCNKLYHKKNIPGKKWWSIAKSFLGKIQIQQFHLSVMERMLLILTVKILLFLIFFLCNSELEDTNANAPPYSHEPWPVLSNITATTHDVLDILKSLDTHKATGADGIGPKMLKEAAPAIAESLTKLINMSLDCKIFPKSSKLANVLPLFKKNDKCNIGNYRPISLLSCTSKIMERVVFTYTFNFIRDNKLLTPVQSGFVPGNSTINQLLNIYHLLCDALDKKKDVRIVFCDISKAFDRVWHKGLLYKLHRFGIKWDLLQWYGSYLQNRCQRVVLGNATSDIGFIKAGVPQGSVLGLLLFLVFINDITENLSCNIRLSFCGWHLAIYRLRVWNRSYK